MKFAANYSPQLAGLVQAGLVDIDLFKTPPWPDMVTAAEKLRPVAIHFPFHVGSGRGEAYDSHSHSTPDWAAAEAWLARTETRYINLHFNALAADFPHIPRHSLAPDHVAEVTEATIRDVQAVVQRWGAERVIIENNHGWDLHDLRLCALPDIINDVVAATGCGLLLDLSHARLAAMRLDCDAMDLLQKLPLGRCGELHITGIQYLPDWVKERLQVSDLEFSPEEIAAYQQRPLDHLPLTDGDWPWMHWLARAYQQGSLGSPWQCVLECGGTGPLWQALTHQQALAEQIPRLYALFRK